MSIILRISYNHCHESPPFFSFFFKEKTPQKRRVGNREKKLESRKEGEETGVSKSVITSRGSPEMTERKQGWPLDVTKINEWAMTACRYYVGSGFVCGCPWRVECPPGPIRSGYHTLFPASLLGDVTSLPVKMRRNLCSGKR